MNWRPSDSDPTDATDPAARPDGNSALRPIGSASLTQRALQVMIQGIHTGAFKDGRVPPEDALAEMLAVSRTTIRHALQSLEQLGLIERRPGRGTRLRRHASLDLLALHGLVPFPTLLRELGRKVATQVRWKRTEVLDAELNLLLGRSASRVSYRRDVVLFADGEPAISMFERFPADVVSMPPDDDHLNEGSILLLSERCFKEKIHHAIATIEPHVASPDNGGTAAGVKPGVAYLLLNETFYSEGETAVAASQVSINPQYVSFSVFRRFL